MTEAELKARLKAFSLRVIRLVDALPNSRIADVIARQLPRSATSVGANYRAACRARSTADFAGKLAITEEEADETEYWLDLLSEIGIVRASRLMPLQRECGELLAIIAASRKTVRRSIQSKIENRKSKIAPGRTVQ